MKSALRWAGVALLALAAAGAGWRLHLQRQESVSGLANAYDRDVRMPAMEGGERRLSEWRGHYLLVNFWATWCAPCVDEIPLLIAAQARYGPHGLQVVGPAMDALEAVRIAAPQMGINYPVMAGDTPVAQAMDALGDRLGALPYSVLIAPDGRILERHHGPYSAESLDQMLARHLP